MKVNELLLWLSARKQGSWEQFKGAVESLHLPDDPSGEAETEESGEDRGGLPLYQELRLNLSGLGHVEFFADGCDAGWRVAPAVLAVRRLEQGWSGILCGARSRALLERLRQAAAGRAVMETEEHDASPLLYRFAAPDIRPLEELVVKAGLTLQEEPTLAILGSLPSVFDRRFLRAGELRMGPDWRVDRFSQASLRWSQSSREEALDVRDGLFRFSLSYEWLHFLRMRGATYETPGQIAKYVLLRQHRRTVVRHDAQAQTLTVPASCRPPLLVDRSLVLCTGVLPSFNRQNTTLTYTGIPTLAARLASRLLGQET